jgi:tetratricopeptide (TPR) repeat protein
VCLSTALAGEPAKPVKPPEDKKPTPVKPAAQWQKDLAEGRELFKAGKFKEAQEVLQRAFEANPGDRNVNWFLGRAAYEAKDFETAAMAFERMLVLEPKALRVRLELARSYFMLGLYDLATDEFTKVMNTNPPAAVQVNVNRYLDLIKRGKKRHYFSGLVNVSTHWDTNPRAAPANEDIKTVLGDVLLDPTAQEEDDTFQSATVALQHKFRLGEEGFFFKSSALLYGTMYDDLDEQNVMFASGRAGLAYEQKEQAYELNFHYDHLTKDDDEYVNIRGLTLSATRVFTPQYIGNVTLRGDKKKYRPPLTFKDAETRDVTGRLVMIYGPNRVFPNVGYEVEEAEDDTESYTNLHMGIGYQRELPWGLVAAVSYGFRLMEYEDEQDIFGEARHDEIHDFGASLTKKIGKHFEVQASYAWTETYSNIEIYEYDRGLLSVGVNFKF